MSKFAKQYLSDFSKYFIRKGRKSTMDSLITKFLFVRAAKQKEAIHNYLETCYNSAIPYIRLKTRKRRKGKKVMYRVNYIDRKKGPRLGLSAFSKQIINKKSKYFITKFENEIEAFGKMKNYIIRTNRNIIHKEGLKALKRKKKSEEKSRVITYYEDDDLFLQFLKPEKIETFRAGSLEAKKQKQKIASEILKKHTQLFSI